MKRAFSNKAEISHKETNTDTSEKHRSFDPTKELAKRLEGIGVSSSSSKVGPNGQEGTKASSSRSEIGPKNLSENQPEAALIQGKNQGFRISSKYRTDKGRKIPICSDPETLPHHTPEEIRKQQNDMIEYLHNEGFHVKLLSDYDPSHPPYNCDSYVFTDGKAEWLSYKATERIIKDNGFTMIASGIGGGYSKYNNRNKPEKEDIILYKNDNGVIVHSGVVSITNKNPKKMIIISKFGAAGIIEHSATIPDVFGATHWEIYHTNRPGGRLITDVSKK